MVQHTDVFPDGWQYDRRRSIFHEYALRPGYTDRYGDHAGCRPGDYALGDEKSHGCAGRHRADHPSGCDRHLCL